MRSNPWKVSTLLLAGALAVALALPLVSRADAGNAQPHLKAALTATRTAKRQLNKAAADPAGHRTRALDLVTRAEAEIQKALAAGGQDPPP